MTDPPNRPTVGVYTLSAETHFSGAHALPGYPGGCARIHGHNFRVRIEVEATELDGVGMAIDFKTLSAELTAITDRFDHRLINEIAPFDQLSPSSEHLARFIYQTLAPRLPAPVRLRFVELWETQKYGCRYEERSA